MILEDGVESGPSSPSHRRTNLRRGKWKNAHSAAGTMNLARSFWVIVYVTMAAALEIDWLPRLRRRSRRGQ
jgi:hypothetical protein